MRLLPSLCTATVALALSSCGSTVAAAPPGPHVATAASLALPTTAQTGAPAAGACADAAATALGAVAKRIYRQSVNGRNLTASMRRLTTSVGLADAVARDDPARIRRLLPALDKNQVVRLLITDRRGRVLASKGMTRSFAPQRGTLRAPRGRVVGHVLVAISGDAALVGIVHRVTGDDVVLTGPGDRRVAATDAATPTPAAGATSVKAGPRSFRVQSFASRQFPTGGLRVDLLTPSLPASLCAPSAAETGMNALAFVGRRLYAAEGRSPEVTRSLARAAQLPLMREAMAERDAHAIRAAIVVLFQDHRFHIVRVRTVDPQGRLLFDLGGPHALAPAFTSVAKPGGGNAGRLELSVQDDTGYIKLMQRFGRVAVILHEGTRLVPGSTFRWTGAPLPDAGTVSFHGSRFRVRSFTGPKFPDGALRVSLLQRVGARRALRAADTARLARPSRPSRPDRRAPGLHPRR